MTGVIRRTVNGADPFCLFVIDECFFHVPCEQIHCADALDVIFPEIGLGTLACDNAVKGQTGDLAEMVLRCDRIGE